MKLKVKWYGDRVKKHVLKAAVGALNETADAAASRGRDVLRGQGGPYYTGELEADIGRIDDAEAGKHRAWVHWGAPDSDHALWQEVGARGEPGKHFLRQAADEEYPRLAGRIKKRLD